MNEDKRLFIPCPKCWNRNYEWDTMTADEENGVWIFNVKCSKCKHVYSNKTVLNRDQPAEGREQMAELARRILNPKMLAELAKATQKEMENDE